MAINIGTAVAATAADFFTDLFNRLSAEHPMSLEELAEVNGVKLDRLIRKVKAEQGLIYRGGKFRIAYMEESQGFTVSFDLYFQDSEGNWVKKNSMSRTQSFNYLTPEAVQEIKSKRVVTLDVSEPE